MAAVLLIGGVAAVGAAVPAAGLADTEADTVGTNWRVVADDLDGGTVRSTLGRGDVVGVADRVSWLHLSDRASAVGETVDAVREDERLDSLTASLVALVGGGIAAGVLGDASDVLATYVVDQLATITSVEFWVGTLTGIWRRPGRGESGDGDDGERNRRLFL